MSVLPSRLQAMLDHSLLVVEDPFQKKDLSVVANVIAEMTWQHWQSWRHREDNRVEHARRDRLAVVCLEADALWPLHPLGVLADLERPDNEGAITDPSDPEKWKRQIRNSLNTLLEYAPIGKVSPMKRSLTMSPFFARLKAIGYPRVAHVLVSPRCAVVSRLTTACRGWRCAPLLMPSVWRHESSKLTCSRSRS
jgi:hypothetical protein